MRNTLAQLYEFFGFLYAGCIVGALSVLLCALRMRMRGKLILRMLDVLYALLCGVVCIAAYYRILNGELRLFGLLGVALGAYAFFRIVSPPLKNLICKRNASKSGR